MKNINTVFILGAGASVPYGFPTSKELRIDVIENCWNRYFPILPSDEKYQKLSLKNKQKEVEAFQKRFRLSSIFSIDYFISRHPEFVNLGKDAIILHLLEFERQSKFREQTKIRESDWYSYLYNYLISDSRKAESFSKISRKNISFLTFNYDRSFEYFLIESLYHSFQGIKQDDIEQIILNLSIKHIYGTISNLSFFDNQIGLKYGSKIDNKILADHRGNIKTVSEGYLDDDDITDLISEAEKIFFLGFGFDKINMTNIGIPYNLRQGQKIYATALGYNDRFISDLKEYFIDTHYSNRKTFGNPKSFRLNIEDIIIKKVDSLKLLEEYL